MLNIVPFVLWIILMSNALYGQNLRQYIQSDKNYTFHDLHIDDAFLQETLQELSHPRLLRFNDFQEAHKADLLEHGNCYGRIILYGDFNRDKISFVRKKN